MSRRKYLVNKTAQKQQLKEAIKEWLIDNGLHYEDCDKTAEGIADQLISIGVTEFDPILTIPICLN